MKKTKLLIALPLTFFLGVTVSFSDGTRGRDGGWKFFHDDARLHEASKTVENHSVVRNGGAIYADDDLNISGTISFNNNSAGGRGGAIYADDDLYFSGAGTQISFSGNKAAGKNNDIFLSDHGGKIRIRDTGTYVFGGGIDASRNGNLSIGNGASATFKSASVNTIGGATRIESGANVVFEKGSENKFLGGLFVSGENTKLSLGGNITLGGRIVVAYDAATRKFAELDFSNAQSVTLLPGSALSISGYFSAQDLRDKEYILISGTSELPLASFAGFVVADAPLYKTVSEVNTANQVVLKTTQKTTADATASVGGNATAAVVLYGEQEILDVPSYAKARENTHAATGELVASDAYARLRRTFSAHNRVGQFLNREIAGLRANPERKSGGTAVSKGELYQASNGEIPGGAQASMTQENPWEFAVAYSGNSAEVAAADGFGSYDFSGNSVWLGLKKSLKQGTLGFMLESGNTTTESSSAKIDAQELGLTAFFFLPITEAGTYAFLQTRFSKEENDFTRFFSGTHYRGKFSSWVWSAQSEIGTRIVLTDWLLANPYASIAYALTDAERFSDGANSYSGMDAYEAEIKPGIRLRSDFSVAGFPAFFSVGAAWIYLCADERLDLEVSRRNATADVLGNRGEQNFIEASFDSGIDLTDNISGGFGYAYADSSESTEHRIYLRASYRF